MSVQIDNKSRILPPLGFGVPSLLPPCVVCGDKGSGLHYGVNTCNSCKGFFYRNSSRKWWPQCTPPGQCKTIQNVRQKCCKCRFEECVRKGMSKKAIKTGRYTYQTKTQYAEEVERLQLQVRMCKSEAALLTPEERQKELDHLINAITKDHLKQTPTHEFVQGLPEREKKFITQKKFEKAMFGSLRPLPYDEFWQIYEGTELDIGGRRQGLIDTLPSFERSIKTYIIFMKSLPGFKKLPIDDQLMIVKGMLFENELLTTYHIYNSEDHIWSDPFNPDLMMDGEQMEAYYEPEAQNVYCECICDLQDLDLLPEEQAVLQAFIITHTDVNVSPEGRRILLAMQEVLFDALYQLINRHHDQPDLFLAKVISIINKIKLASPIIKRNEKTLMEQYPDVDLSPTILELYT